MTKTKTKEAVRHTPGPWGVNSAGQVIKDNDSSFVVANPYMSHGDDVADANARLIATAPDGLALAKIVADMQYLSGENRHNQEIAARELAKSIIAKAEWRP